MTTVTVGLRKNRASSGGWRGVASWTSLSCRAAGGPQPQPLGVTHVQDHSGCFLVRYHAGIVSVIASELHLPDKESEGALEAAAIGFEPSLAIDRNFVIIEALVVEADA
ncbi:MAG: hypothetical protein GF399_05890 [Candidatus Coatesbacteria bacterium]|nr:hypothetical protein [Candidatus Coatesbacteria bacterium]